MAYRHGIDNIRQADCWLSNKNNVGLITNYTGLDSNFRRTVDILNERYNLAKVFAPEHGLEGVAQANDDIPNEVDKVSGLSVVSMFGFDVVEDKLFEGIDVVAFDIQDIGLRTYTYISVLAKAMKLCKDKGIPVIVFDRYNPLGLRKTSGTLLDEEFSSIIGMYELPLRHAMTVGEYARYINAEKKIGCELYVVPCENLTREDDFFTLNLPWLQPSPNMPSFLTALVSVGTMMFEGTNVSEGRGTTRPFEMIGAPWIDSVSLSDMMNEKKLPGVYFRPASFVPTFSKYVGERCNGVQVLITDYETFEPFYCGLSLMDTIRNQYKEFDTRKLLKESMGTDEFLLDTFQIDKFVEKHRHKIEEFLKRTEKYRLY